MDNSVIRTSLAEAHRQNSRIGIGTDVTQIKYRIDTLTDSINIKDPPYVPYVKYSIGDSVHSTYVERHEIDGIVKDLFVKYIKSYARRYGDFPIPTDEELNELFE